MGERGGRAEARHKHLVAVEVRERGTKRARLPERRRQLRSQVFAEVLGEDAWRWRKRGREGVGV